MYHNMRDLCALDGISGRESAVRDYILNALKSSPCVHNIHVDRMGNCIVSLKGKKPAVTTVAFVAHMDEVGGIVTGITDEGFVRFANVGGINADALFSKVVWINGHAGVIGAKAVHQCKGDEKKTIPGTLLIDIGADSAEQARQIVREGDAVIFTPNFMDMTDTTFCSKALDDRAGCAILLELAQTTPEYDVTLIFTVQEEVGTRGALTASFAVQPEIAVILDVTTAQDIYGVPVDKQVTYFGGGPAVSFMDRSTMYDTELYKDIRAFAYKNGIPTQTKTTVAGGNDSRSFQTTGIGARVAAISLPCRYIHSSASVLDREDVDNTYRLLHLLRDHLPSGERLV